MCISFSRLYEPTLFHRKDAPRACASPLVQPQRVCLAQPRDGLLCYRFSLRKTKDIRNNFRAGLELLIEFLLELLHDFGKQIQKNTIGIVHGIPERIPQTKINVLSEKPDAQFSEQPYGPNALPSHGADVRVQALGGDEDAPVPRPQIVDRLGAFEAGKSHHLLRSSAGGRHERHGDKQIAHRGRHDEEQEQKGKAEEQITQNDVATVP